MSVTAIVPVKTFSERLEKKNLQTFIDCPMYEHKLKQLKDVPFDKVVVSSESKVVCGRARDYGFEAHYRDPKYSTPDIPMSEVYKYISSEVEGDDIAWINVNNPLVTGDIYFAALYDWTAAKSSINDCLLSVSNLQKYLFWDGRPLNWVPSEHPKSQDLQGVKAMNFAINIRPRKDVIREGHFIGNQPFFYNVDRYAATKVDYLEDLEFCRDLWNKKS